MELTQLDNSFNNKAQPWIDKISKQEMPALASTVRELENLAKDDTASLAKLGQAVLHDHALTSSILKVANSSLYMSRNPVTTVSRAAVVLGLSTVKNICITSKLLSSLLKNKNLTPGVYNRLIKLMAQSFHAGMLAKMMVAKYDVEIQEQTFIAALLNKLGESAFWSIGGEITDKLDQELLLLNNKSESAKLIIKELGISFEAMTIGLARNWKLGDILLNSLIDPQLRTPEIQSINLAVQLSELLSDPEHTVSDLSEMHLKISKIMGISKKEVELKISNCSKDTIKLLNSYGAGALTKFINHPSNKHQNNDNSHENTVSAEALQLQIIRELAFLPSEGADFNIVIQTALEGIYRGIKMNRALVLLKNKQTRCIVPRFISAQNAVNVKNDFTLSISGITNIFSYTMKYREPIWIKGHDDEKFKGYLTEDIKKIVPNSDLFLAPLLWKDQCIGLFYADRNLVEKSNTLNEKDFMAFTLFVQQTNLCLSLI